LSATLGETFSGGDPLSAASSAIARCASKSRRLANRMTAKLSPSCPRTDTTAFFTPSASIVTDTTLASSGTTFHGAARWSRAAARKNDALASASIPCVR
jgi:hypothetical protein